MVIGTASSSKVVSLGTGTSFNVSSYAGYQNFTSDNFIVEIVSLPSVIGASTGKAGYYPGTTGCTITKTYNNQSGILTIGGLTQKATISDSYGTTVYATANQTVNVKVWLIYS